MGRVIEFLLLEPAQIAHRPALLARIDATVPEHEGADLLPMHAQRFHRRRSRADEISHRLMAFVRDPDCCQFASPQQSRQRDRVATVRLHPIARFPRNQ